MAVQDTENIVHVVKTHNLSGRLKHVSLYALYLETKKYTK